MSKYKILPYSYEQANKLNVVIVPSTNPKKKIDVYKKVEVPPLKYSSLKQKADKKEKEKKGTKRIKAPLGYLPPTLYSKPGKNIKNPIGSKKVASIGAYGYPDYPTYMKTEGKEYADEKRRLYQTRHKGEDKKKDTPGYYAWHILW